MSPPTDNDGGFILLEAIILLVLLAMLAAGPGRLLRDAVATGERLEAALVRDAAEGAEAAGAEEHLYRRR
jgi:type II secretory pathway component PulJ